MKFRRIFFVFSLSILCAGISVVVAKAPDTAKIAFVSNRDRNREIYIMNPDGTEKVRLTQNFAVDLYPTWSPTGEKILFVSDQDGNRDLYLMDANGSNVRRVFKNRRVENIQRGLPMASRLLTFVDGSFTLQH